MHTMLIKIFSLLFIISWTDVSIAKREKFIEMLKFGSCSEYPELPMVLTSRKKKTADSNRTMELNISIKKKLGSKLEGTIDFWKCDSKGSPASCEYVAKDLKIRNVCDIMLAKNQAWSLVVEGFKPPLRCPFEARLYQTEYAINDRVFKFFPVSTGVWKAKGFLYSDERDMLICVDFHARVIEKRT